MKRKFLNLILVIFFAITAGFKPASTPGDPGRPNILFIFTDDLAYQAISAYGFGLNKTPNIDRLADEGMLFNRCLVTNSICGPSRAAILTGKYSHMNGFYNNEQTEFDGSQQTFPRILQRGGYQTAIVGKWHLGSEPTGFDYWEVMRGQGFYYNPEFITEEGEKVIEGYSVNVVRERAINWLDNKRDKDKPFMLMAQFKAPHREWEPGPDHLTRYDEHIFPEPATLFDDYTGRGTAAKNQQMTIANHMVLEGDNKLYTEKSKEEKLGRSYARMTQSQRGRWDSAYQPKNEKFYRLNLSGDDLTRWKYQRYMQDYMSVVAALDDNVGQLLEYLEKNNLEDNTIVVLASDQGFFLGEHGWFDKRWMYEESFRTPLIVRWPTVTEPGSVSNAIVSNLDFAETFIDAAGVNIPGDMQGRSILPILSGGDPSDWRKSFYYHYYEGGGHGVPKHEGVYMDSLKLINFYTINEWEMYDLRRDPHELYSVLDNPEYSQEKKILQKELIRLRKELKVPENEGRD